MKNLQKCLDTILEKKGKRLYTCTLRGREREGGREGGREGEREGEQFEIFLATLYMYVSVEQPWVKLAFVIALKRPSSYY